VRQLVRPRALRHRPGDVLGGGQQVPVVQLPVGVELELYHRQLARARAQLDVYAHAALAGALQRALRHDAHHLAVQLSQHRLGQALRGQGGVLLVAEDRRYHRVRQRRQRPPLAERAQSVHKCLLVRRRPWRRLAPAAGFAFEKTP